MYERGEGIGIQLTGLTPPYFYACPKPGPGFPFFFVFNDFSNRDIIIYYEKKV
jgi:hypothetical protein